MTVAGGGLFVANWAALVGSPQLALNWALTTNLVAMYTATVTPDYSASTANAAYGAGVWNANEVSGTGYTAGGLAVSSPTTTDSPAGTLMLDIADMSWPTSTITGARCALVYMPTLTPKAAFGVIDFGAAYDTVGGNFAIQWASVGAFWLKLVPGS
jgi:hypothetical protein